MNNTGLSEEQLKVIANILGKYADKIERVGIFGSRATGNFRPNSDIDLVIFGDLDEEVQNRLYTLFDESNLAIKVDVHIYDLIAYPPLKKHVDESCQTLFSHEQLKCHNVS